MLKRMEGGRERYRADEGHVLVLLDRVLEEVLATGEDEEHGDWGYGLIWEGYIYREGGIGGLGFG